MEQERVHASVMWQPHDSTGDGGAVTDQNWKPRCRHTLHVCGCQKVHSNGIV